jgi:hypothetical protein
MKFKAKLKEYSKSKSYAFFNAIEGMYDIPPEEKLGAFIKQDPFKDCEDSYLDVEIWEHAQ